MIDFWPLFGVFVLGLFVGSNLMLVLMCVMILSGRISDRMEGQG